MDFIEIPCSDGRLIRLKVKEVIYKGSSRSQEIAIYNTEEFRRCLFLNGIIQSSEKDHELYDEQLLKKLRPSDRNILILGGGDGFIAEKALKINPGINVTIVDLDEEVVNVCKRYLSQRVFNNPRVRVVIRDALDFVLNIKGEIFDGIISDLTDFPVGYDNKLRELFSKILSESRRILKEDGWISLYGGVKGIIDKEDQQVIDLLNNILKENFPTTDCYETLIPSFGEPCYFLYGLK